MKPITPDEVVDKKAQQLPDFVIESFNELIAKHWNGQSACFKKEDVVRLIADKATTEWGGIHNERVTRLYTERCLDVEDIYRAVGWVVKYDSPGCNETYPATFEFSKGGVSRLPTEQERYASRKDFS